MSTHKSSKQIQNIVHTDSNLIISNGRKLPKRDASGKRPFTYGEDELLKIYIPELRQIQDASEEAEKELDFCNEQRAIRVEQLNEETLKYKQAQQAAEDEFNKTKERLEQLEQNASEQPAHNQPAPKKRVRKHGMKKFFSFMLVAFVAEIITYFATINLQKENLPMDAILWRFAYILVIYAFTCILYFKYMKTRLKSVKALLIGCFLMSLVCLLHAIAVAFINFEVSTPASSDFSLTSLESVEAESTNAGILANLIYNPGLIEFIVATLFVFMAEIITIDGMSKLDDEAQASSSAGPMVIDFAAIAKENEALYRASLKNKLAKLQEGCIAITTDFNNFLNNINNEFEALEQRKKQLIQEVKQYLIKEDAWYDDRVSDNQNYEPLLTQDLSFKLGEEASSFYYEPATKEDIKERCQSIMNQK